MQVAVNGLLTGLSIAVLALAFSVVYLSTRVFHVALGGVYALAPFVTWGCLRGGWPWYAAILTALAVGAAVSAACELLNHAVLARRRAPPGAHLVSSLGIYIVVVQLIVLTWGNEPKVLRVGLDTVVDVGGLVLTGAQLLEAAVCLALLGAFYLWLRFSNLGLQFRALADNPVEIALRGYNVRWLRLLAFALAGLLATAASLVVAFDLSFQPHTGMTALFLAIVAAIVGGGQSFVGPMLGGLLLGLIRSEVVWLFAARWQDAVTFLLLTAVLLLRPGGLVGRKGRLEADA